MAKPNLALIPATIGDKVYSILPNDGVGDFDFTRGSEATRINAQGLIETVASGENRLNYSLLDGEVVGCPHLLLEPARTNYVEFSNNASQWSNVVSNGTVTKTADYAISPDGTQNATRLEASVSGSGYALISLANTIAFFGDYTATVYVKSNTENNQDIVFYGRNTDFDKHTVTKEWTRIQFKGSSTSGQSNYAYIGISTGIRAEDNPIDILVWGGQLEQGSYATSYIKSNSGGATTRAAETCNNSGNAATFNDSEGVLMVEISAFEDTMNFESITLSDGTTNNNNEVRLYFSPTQNKLSYNLKVNGVTQLNGDLVDVIFKNNNKILIKYKQNNSSLWVNGFKLLSYNSLDVFSNNVLNEISFSRGNDTLSFYGKTKQLQYFDSILDSEQLEQLTSWDSFRAMAEGQLYTIE